MRDRILRIGKKVIDGFHLFIVCMLVSNTGSVVAQNDVNTACLSTSGEAAVTACRHALDLTPNDITVRLTLSDALINLRHHKEAIEVLKEGLVQFPRNERIKKKLAFAQSDLEEQLWIEKRRAQEDVSSSGGSAKKLDTATKLNKIRCTKLKGVSALKACDKALEMLSDDPSLHHARADALLSMQRISESIVAYQKSLRLDPGNTETSKKLTEAESKRKNYSTQCQQLDGSAALSACDTAFLEGAADELAIQIRRGELLQDMNKASDAINAYNAALLIEPGNREIEKQIAILSEPQKVTKAEKPLAKPPKSLEPKKSEKPHRSLTAKNKTDTSKLLPLSESTLANIPDQLINEPQVEIAHPMPPDPELQQPRLYSNAPSAAGITH